MNDKGVIQDAQRSFDVLVLQANLAVSAARGLASWEELRKPFWIDPIAYAFAAQPSYLMSEQKVERGSNETRLDFKRTFRSLADRYGDPFARVINERRSLRPDDFDASVDEDVARRIIEWQRSALAPAAEDAKYLEAEQLEPVLWTVPYFPIQRSRGGAQPEWLDVNLRLVRAASAIYPSALDRLAVGLLIETNLFDADWAQVEPVLDAYLELEPRHLWLWLSDNEEVEMSVPRAERLLRFIERAAASGKIVHQAFGGSFSSLLLRRGLTSVGHGVGYWEHKNWEPLAGGGRPTLRFFYPPLRRRLPFLDADQVIDMTGIEDADDFHRNVCGCPVCVETLEGELANFARFGRVEVRTRVDRWGNAIEYDVPLPESMYRTKRHYLEAKAREVAEVLDGSFDSTSALNDSITVNRGQDIDDLRHLEDWRDVLLENHQPA